MFLSNWADSPSHPKGEGFAFILVLFFEYKKARTALKIPAETPSGTCIIYGKATVQISKYMVNRNESEVHDVAFLDKVISFDKPTFRKECSVVP